MAGPMSVVVVAVCAVFTLRGACGVTVIDRFEDLLKPRDTDPLSISSEIYFLPDPSSNKQGDSVPPVGQIIGGDDADPSLFPHQAALQVQFRGIWYFICGGSLTSPRQVVTAAHCLLYNGILRHRVVLGSTGPFFTGPYAQAIDVQRIVPHSRYKGESRKHGYPNDIGVIQLASDAQFNDFVRPVEVASVSEPIGQRCMLAGYGYTEPGVFQIAPVLQNATLDVISFRECLDKWGHALALLNVCTLSPMMMPCNGDSGSGLICDGKLHALVSWGPAGCPRPVVYPSVFVGVAHYRKWLEFLDRQ